jgi:hypothetical protein
MEKSIKIILITLIFSIASHAQESEVQLIRLKYDGGGDWYNDQSSDVNLTNFVKQNTNIDVKPAYNFVDLSSDKLFDFPLVWLTGHGNIKFSNSEAERLRLYLENGGFLYIDDDYGLDKYIREEMKKVFPEAKFEAIPFQHGIFNSHFDFSKGLPKIHEHDDQIPKAYGIFIDDRLAVFYTFESNLGDGWADEDVHNDPPEKREQALKMGTNIIVWALSN